MNPDREREDATLLCERCGYVLEGLDAGGTCPECGKRIAESLPSVRTGTPWQQRRGVGAWWRTLGIVAAHPVRTTAVMRVDGRGMRALAWVNVTIAGVLLALCWARSMWAVQIRFGPHASGWWEVVLAAATVMVCFMLPTFAVGLFVLTWIEALGVRFFGNQRGWRVHRGVASAVCAHMTYWWVVGAAVTLAVALALPEREPNWALTRWLWSLNVPALDVRMLIGAAVFFAAGLLPFECAVYYAVRKCRFANQGERKP